MTLALLCSLLVLFAQGGAADGQIHAAGIVVDYGDGRVTYAYVPFAEDELSGIELLRRSGIPLVSVSFGGLGEGVCALDQTGCDVTECRRRLCQSAERSSPFWQYVRQTSTGEWRPFALGASQSTVRNGDVDGWAWTGTAPSLPAISIAEVRQRAGGGTLAIEETGAVPEPMVRTVGGAVAASGDEPEMRQALLGVGVLIAVGIAGGLVVRRTRRPPRGADS